MNTIYRGWCRSSLSLVTQFCLVRIMDGMHRNSRRTSEMVSEAIVCRTAMRSFCAPMAQHQLNWRRCVRVWMRWMRYVHWIDEWSTHVIRARNGFGKSKLNDTRPERTAWIEKFSHQFSWKCNSAYAADAAAASTAMLYRVRVCVFVAGQEMGELS